ncbi:NAD(P)H-dependent oxidoreductase [Azospirillum halopraeferens]|uniref:NAD(P)H-dependent oxidoreductase n=1 Tax=Azospirillum halopraeferens TaxID=34010 RepID=UPI0004260A1D|nr:NAD(P)H-dependent oxidoreductase [Azospirillum halopraeferens]
MNVFILYAHPEPQSLNGSLKDFAVATLTDLGHSVAVSDLYAMGWKATADGDDFPVRQNPDRLHYPRESASAYTGGTQPAAITAEQNKLLWADAVILQFPLWWYSMPAIMKGWFERVYAYGFAYGVGEHGGERWGDRFGEGTLLGRRALVSTTIGGREPQYTRGGVNGSLFDVLWPIQHGTLYYPGMAVLDPFVVYRADSLTPERWHAITDQYRTRLETLFTADPIPFRRQNGGHYDGQQVLKDGLGGGETGLRMHLLQPGEPPEHPLGRS